MRLSTVSGARRRRAPRRCWSSAIDHGVTLLDTADAYAHDDADRGHNERLVAAACAARPTLAGADRHQGRHGAARRALAARRARGHLLAAAAAPAARATAADRSVPPARDRSAGAARDQRAGAGAAARRRRGSRPSGCANVGRAQLEGPRWRSRRSRRSSSSCRRCKTDALRSGLVAWCARARRRGAGAPAVRRRGGGGDAVRASHGRDYRGAARRVAGGGGAGVAARPRRGAAAGRDAGRDRDRAAAPR
jgi:hypothetical protein